VPFHSLKSITLQMMCRGKGMVPSWITVVQPETNGIPWHLGRADFSTLLLHSCQQIPLIIQTARMIAHLLMFPTICIKYMYTKPLTQRCQRMPIQSQDTSLFNFRNYTPHLSQHDTHLHCTDVSHFDAQLMVRRRYPECSQSSS
jgi:hypothetical protein